MLSNAQLKIDVTRPGTGFQTSDKATPISLVSEQESAVMTRLRTEWRGTIEDINQHIRHLDSQHQVRSVSEKPGDAARQWRLMLLAWRDELMDLLRQYPAPR